MDAKTLKTVQTLPAFLGWLLVEVRGQIVPLGEQLLDFHKELLTQLGPALEAVALGKPPPVSAFVLLWSKGTGKTTITAACLLHLLLITRRCLEVRVAAGDETQARETELVVKDMIRHRPALGNLIEVRNCVITNRVTGSRIAIVAADARTQPGGRVHVQLVEECTRIASEDLFDQLMGNAGKMGGVFICCSNAGILGSWQVRKLEALRDAGAFYSHVCQPPPWKPAAELALEQSVMLPSTFRMLYHTEHADGNAGDGIPPEQIDASIDPTCKPLTERSKGCIVAGVDLALKVNAAALVCIEKTTCNNSVSYRLAHVESWRPRSQYFGMVKAKEIDLEAVVERIVEIHQRIGMFSCVFDPWNAGAPLQALQRRGVPAVSQPFTADFRQAMSTALVNNFRDRKFALYNHPGLIGDLKKCRITEKPFSGFTLTWPRGADGSHCDVGAAFAIAAGAAASDDVPAGEWNNPAIGKANPEAKGLVARLFERIGLIEPGDLYGQSDSKAREMADGAVYTESKPGWTSRELWSRHDSDR